VWQAAGNHLAGRIPRLYSRKMLTVEGEEAGKSPYTLTRRDVAARLGVSVSSVRRMEFDRLHPQEDEHGVWRFDPAELEGMPVRQPVAPRRGASVKARAQAREGRVAARVFRMFARHWTLPQIVVATGQPPHVVRRLFHEWSTSLEVAEWSRA
jgi:hypothetical protein